MSPHCILVDNSEIPGFYKLSMKERIALVKKLAGQTPAERAGVGVEGENKWLSLLRSALAKTESEIN